MLRRYLLAGLLGLASAQSSPVVNDWYTAAAGSSTPTAISGTVWPAIAVAIISPFGGTTVQGSVVFHQADMNSPTLVIYDLTGSQPNMMRGIHIHETGSTDCIAAGPHFDPFNTKAHGLLNDPLRHAGDLGNIMMDGSGNAKGVLSSDQVSLVMGSLGVIGRTFVMHGGEDDGGKTGKNTSSSTGNSGARVACGIINPST